jgi:DNA repair protein RadC
MQVSSNITNAHAAEAVLHDHMHDLDHEEVWAVFLDLRAKVIDQLMLSKGTLTQTSIDCRTVLRNALLVNASSLILLHNHPSGDPRPSVQDINFTDRLRKACSLMDIKLLDHIVIGRDGFFSFANESITNY